jgi:uncharacterized protein (DUF2237 family)
MNSTVAQLCDIGYIYLCNKDNFTFYESVALKKFCTCSAPWLVARDGGSAVPQLELDITDAENIALGKR